MVNVAVIGIGSMGRNHARVYSELGSANLVAISDIDESGRKIAQKFGCKFYRDYGEMLGEDIDAVSIAVPTKLHKNIALDCIRAEKHVLIEKPIADNLKNAEDIIKAAEKEGVILTVGHIERFNPAVQKLKELIDRKKLGKITSIIAKRVGIFPPQIKDANVFLDLAVHDIDVFNYLLDACPRTIYSKAGKALNKGREDNAVILLDYESAACLVHVNWITPVKIRTLAATGTKGYAELNYISQDLVVYESIYERTYDSFGDFVIKFGTPKEVKVGISKEEPLKIELKHFLSCIEKKKEPLVTGRSALLALKLSLGALQSYKKNEVVEVEN